ncbi:MAG: ribonuclease D, partial [Acidobacteriota bacterium]|nr:ribonuclease D [Acidobacteriota bacterium]
MLPESPQPVLQVESDEALRTAVRGWRELPALALDTEFVRERTFYPRLGLVQVSDGRASYLVDPLKIRDAAPFAELLADPAVVKVLHSASEDVEVFYRALGTVPR